MPGVGVGATATIGPSLGVADAAGSPDDAGEGAIDGATDDGGGSGALPVLPTGVGEAAGGAGLTRDGDGAGDEPIAAMS